MAETQTPIFNAVLAHLQSTGKLPKFGTGVQSEFVVTLQSGGGCRPDADGNCLMARVTRELMGGAAKNGRNDNR